MNSVIKVYILGYNQFVDRSLDKVFTFFEKPENPGQLTPRS